MLARESPSHAAPQERGSDGTPLAVPPGGMPLQSLLDSLQPILASLSADAELRDEAAIPPPRELFTELAGLGLVGAALPVSVGGGGKGVADWGRILQHLGYHCEDSAVSLNISLFQAVAAMILESGNSDLVDRHVRAACRGERLTAFAYTEDSDAFSMRSALVQRNGGYVASGAKEMVTAGQVADSFMTYVVSPDQSDIAVILLDRDMEGVSVSPVKTLGLRSSGMASLTFDNVTVPESHVLMLHGGLEHVQTFLNARRVTLCCGPLGRMKRIVESCVGEMNQRVRYGAPLSDMQLVQARIGRMQANVTVAETLLEKALTSLAALPRQVDVKLVSATKLAVTERLISVALDALRLTGARGYAQGCGFGRFLRDCLGLVAGAGAQDILETNIGMITIAEGSSLL